MNSKAATMAYMKVSMSTMERSGLGGAGCCTVGVCTVRVGLGMDDGDVEVTVLAADDGGAGIDGGAVGVSWDEAATALAWAWALSASLPSPASLSSSSR
jgi:hypothetical protein